MSIDSPDEPDAPGLAATPERAIASVAVTGLHGKFAYDLDVGPSTTQEPSDLPEKLTTVSDDRLTLLYGKNGTGKTSLLRLLFHALSPAPNRGHRHALQGMRFQSFRIGLTDGSYVTYGRESTSDAGPFLSEVRVGADAAPVACEWFTEQWRRERWPTQHVMDEPIEVYLEGTAEEILVRPGSRQAILPGTARYIDIGRSRADQFLEALAELRINPVFLEDSRAITGDVLDTDDAKRLRAAGRARAARAARDRGLDPDDDAPQRELDIEEALERVRVYFSQLAFKGTQAGSLRVDTVYVNVAAAIIQHSSEVGPPNERLVPALRAKVHELNERAARFQKYGLLPESPMAELAGRLQEAEVKHGPLLAQVLTPHLDGFAQRMDALEPGLDAVAAFVDALNTFLGDKTVRFSPGRAGVHIEDGKSGERIVPSDLSSGEKQILLMFSDIIALQDETRLFLIDEPELSLNPDWQRSLLPSLLGVTKASGMQLIAATHSIEIMARYRDRRRELPG